MTSIPWQVQSDLATHRQQEFRAEAATRRTWRDARRAASETRRTQRQTAARPTTARPTTAAPRGVIVEPTTT